MTTKEKIKVMEDYLDGKKIIFRATNSPDEPRYYITVTSEPDWDWSRNIYKVVK